MANILLGVTGSVAAIRAPAMNTLMWQNPLTTRHLRQLAEAAGASPPPKAQTPEEVMDWINARCPRLRVVAPESRRLACGDIGVGALAGLEQITAAVAAM